MAKVVLCCGKVCSGKSTFTERLEASYGYFSFSADDWMLRLFDQTEDRAVFDRNLSRSTEMIHRLALRLLDRGIDVALDFGFWKERDRKATVERYAARGHDAVLVYFPVDDETQIRHMAKRQAVDGMRHYRFDEATIAVLNGFFEEPSSDEPCLSADQYLIRLADNEGKGKTSV